jgi:hypothetical protein
MLIKTGKPVKTDKDSNKILSKVEIDENKKILKESKLKKEEDEPDNKHKDGNQ